MGGENTVLKISDHIVICNCNPKAGRIIQELYTDTPDHKIVLIVQNEALWRQNTRWHPQGVPAGHYKIVIGSPFDRNTLKKVAIEKARAAVILADPDEGELADATSTLVAINIEQENPEVHTVMELLLSINRKHLRSMNVDEVVCLGEISEKLIAQSCISPGIKTIFASLLSASHNTARIFTPEIPEKLVGVTYRELARRAIVGNCPFIVIGFIQYRKNGEQQPDLHKLLSTNMRRIRMNPRKHHKDLPLSSGDQLIIIGNKRPDLTPLSSANRGENRGKFDLTI